MGQHRVTAVPATMLLLLMLCSRSHGQLEIDTVEGSEVKTNPEVTTTRQTTTKPHVTTKPAARGRAADVGPAVAKKPGPFKCIVCDDIKDANCQPWDEASHIKNCYEDPRINKSQEVGCRKMVQHVGDKTYVSRHCTNLVHDSIQGCIERVGTKKIKIKYCHCRRKENCNDGLMLKSGSPLVTVGVAAFLALVSDY